MTRHDTVIAVANDTTDYKILAESLQNFIHSCPLGILQYSLEPPDRLVLRGANPASEAMLGVPINQQIGRTLQEIFPPLASTEIPRHYIEVARDGKIWKTENITYNDASITGAYEVLAFQTSPNRLAVMFQDIAPRLQSERELQRRQRLDSLGVLAGGIAHDFNNLLTGLFGHLEIIKKASQSPSVLASTDAALSVFERTKGLTQQLLTFAKGGAPTTSETDIHRLLKEAASFALSGSSIPVDFELSAPRHTLRVDRNQVFQVVDNIFINAKQAMADQRGRIRVSTSLMPPGELPPSVPSACEHLLIAIHNDGPPIPEGNLPFIFDPFFSTKKGGNGLGLATAHSIIKRHDGAILAESTHAEGTTFKIFLPLTPTIEARPSANDTSPEASMPPPRRVLVLDDEPTVREVLAGVLTALGNHCVAVTRGEDAIDIFAKAHESGQAFDLVILDLTIVGGLGGAETIKKLRAITPKVLAIATSGYSDDPVISSPLKHGFDASLRKPFRLDDIKTLLKEISKAPASSDS
jgi:signal transduction histidine kinase/CheY-like chemotaxis protein